MKTTQTIRKVAFIGEAMVELKLPTNKASTNEDDLGGSTQLGFAGDTLNSAVYLKRLIGDACEVAYITGLGDDAMSQRMVRFIESESIDAERIQRIPGKQIGLYAIDTDESGERSFSYWRGQSAARDLFQSAQGLDFSALEGFDMLCFSAITLAILPAQVRAALLEKLAQLKACNGVSIIFDSNYRPALWESAQQARLYVSAAWRLTDIGLPSVDDEQTLFEDDDEAAVLGRLKTYGLSSGALKRGAQGPVTLEPITAGDGQGLPADSFAQAKPCEIVDTTAAGDSFNAGYLCAVICGLSHSEAMLAGHNCALRVIAHAGAIIAADQWQ